MDIYSRLTLYKRMKCFTLLMSLFVLMTSFSFAQSGAELEENSDGVYEVKVRVTEPDSFVRFSSFVIY